MLGMTRLLRCVAPARSVAALKVAPAALRVQVLASRRTLPAFVLADRVSSRRHFGQTHVARAATADQETYQYQAEVDRLLDMIVNSVYSNKEVFVRELISNASDALDKARITSLTDPDLLSTGTELEVRIKSDKEAKTITIEDTGIGMTKDELLSSLGTIARSGTAKFAEAMKQSKQATGDSNLIGQFGVGFYSAFLVSDRVTVQTKSNDDESQWLWESAAGSHSYNVRQEPAGDLKRGTRITLHLKEDAEDFLDSTELSRLIKQYSEFISFPIKLWSTTSTPKQVEDTEATKTKQEKADKKAKDEGKEEGKKVEPVMKTEMEESEEFKIQNENKPIWTRAPKDVTAEEYNSFFKSAFKEFVDPMALSHFQVEGTYEFSSILFIPGMAPFDDSLTTDAKKSSIRLFVKRVFISDQFDEQLLPRYLKFVKGVVDSSDLPLNVSREILQESRVVRVIRKQLVKRALEMISDFMGKGEEQCEKFWSQFGKQIKLGIVDDQDNKVKLASLLRYKSSKSGDVMTGLDEYVSRMKEGQKAIYYVAAQSDELARNSPFVETLVKKDMEVVFMTEPIDEWCAQNLADYKGNKLLDVSKEGLQLDDADAERIKEAETRLTAVRDFLKAELEGKVSKVEVSARLTDSPCILVTSQYGWSANMQRIMKSQPVGDNRALEYMQGDKILEINPDSEVIKRLNSIVQTDASSDNAKEIATLLYDTAMLTSGFDVASPKDYASKVYDMMSMALSSADTAAPKAQPAPKAAKPAEASKGPSEAVDADRVIEEK